MGKGLLIAFEGIDGTGKTTQLQYLARALRERGYGVVETREPTNGTYGKKIRAISEGFPGKEGAYCHSGR